LVSLMRVFLLFLFLLNGHPKLNTLSVAHGFVLAKAMINKNPKKKLKGRLIKLFKHMFIMTVLK